MKKLKSVIAITSLFAACMSCVSLENNETKIVESETGFQLIYKGEPYFIQGAVASGYFDKIAEYGGNSVRTNRLNREKLDSVYDLGLTVLYGLPMRPERDGMDYDSVEIVQEQFQRVMEKVEEYKDHPAILFWQLGNELDYVDPYTPPNWKVYDAINELAKRIHEVDPTRPVLTVLGTGKKWKMAEFIKRCPDIDLIGINAYKDIVEIPAWLDEFNFDRPYIVTEWGPQGHWQVPRTDRDIPIEQNSTEKSLSYKDHYEKVILKDKGRCLGSYVFYWHQHQEQTHTWYGMFDKERHEAAAVDVMRKCWTGEEPDNLSPEIYSITVDGKTGIDNISFSESQVHKAIIKVSDPDGDSLIYHWEILPENTEFGYGGRGEKKPNPVDCILSGSDTSIVEFSTPGRSGMYRVSVTIYDEGGGHFAYGNIPFWVEPKGRR